MAFVGFVLSSAVHAVAYFNLLGSIGVVSCGVMKGLTTAGYVTISAIAFCGIAAKYCINWQTAISSVVCVGGVMVYSYATANASKAAAPTLINPEEQSEMSSTAAGHDNPEDAPSSFKINPEDA